MHSAPSHLCVGHGVRFAAVADKYGLKAVLSDVYASRLADESQEVKALKRIIDKLEPMKVCCVSTSAFWSAVAEFACAGAIKS